MKETPAIAVYNKAYKQQSANCIRRGKLTKEDFDTWAKLARQKRDECIEGNMPMGDYLRWLEVKWLVEAESVVGVFFWQYLRFLA